MPILTRDSAEIYYEVHGEGQPFLFCSVTGLDHQTLGSFTRCRSFPATTR